MKLYICDKYSIFSGKITYKLTEFSDTQSQIVLSVGSIYTDIKDVKIISRMSWKDLQNIILATKALKRIGIESIHLKIPYMLGARSDRVFEQGSTHYLKDIICPIINSLQFKSVSVLDPHSTVLQACLNNYKELPITHFYEWFIQECGITTDDKVNSFIISPDYGAINRTAFFTKKYGFEKILNCSKIRDTHTGKIVATHIPITDFGKKDCIILDDICDGGTTFIELAKQLKERNAGKIILLVTHGIFSKGFYELFKYIDEIYTTNSVVDFNQSNPLIPPNLFQYEVI